MKSFECFKDQRTSYVNAIITTHHRKRTVGIKSSIEQINASRDSDQNKIILRKQSEFDDEIMTVSRSDGVSSKKHGFYIRIQDAKERGDPTYFCWPRTSVEFRERDLIKELHIDMVKPSGKTQKKTSAYSFDSDNDEGAAGAAGGVEASPETPVRSRSQLGLRKKRMAYRLNEDDEDYAGAAEGGGSALSAAVAEPVPASAPPVAAPALPAALAEPVPAPAPPAAEPAPGPAPRPAAPAQLPFAVYQIACNAIEARMKDKDEMHAEIMKVKHEMYAEIIKTKDEMCAEIVKAKDEKHSELMKAQEEISKLKEEKYLEIIQSSTDCFKRLMDEKDEKYTHVYEMVGHLENAYKRPRSSS